MVRSIFYSGVIERRSDMASYKVHFIDNYGHGTIECDTWEEFREVLKNIRENPRCEYVWTEEFDEGEGWQA